MLLAIATILIVSARGRETADDDDNDATFEQGKSFPLAFIRSSSESFTVFALALSFAQSFLILTYRSSMYIFTCACVCVCRPTRGSVLSLRQAGVQAIQNQMRRTEARSQSCVRKPLRTLVASQISQVRPLEKSPLSRAEELASICQIRSSMIPFSFSFPSVLTSSLFDQDKYTHRHPIETPNHLSSCQRHRIVD